MFLLLAGPAEAQQKLEGTWTAHFLTPAGEVASATYEVRRAGEQLQATMEFAGRRLMLTGYHIHEDRLSFAMEAGFLIECRLDRQPAHRFKGSCMDSMGNVGPAVIAPPGVTADPEHMDPELALKVWGLTREEYLDRRAAMRERGRVPRRSEPVSYPEEEPIPVHMVDVGEFSLNVADVGSGDVTVVLESGVGDDHKVWSHVQEALAKRTRVIAYDRAGLGGSEVSPEPRTPEAIAHELHALLEARDVPPPYVLVGHREGALTVRTFQSLHPDEVAGLVLVDPMVVNEDSVWMALDAESWTTYRSRKLDFLSMLSETTAGEFEAFADVLKSDAAPPTSSVHVPVAVLSGRRPEKSPTWVGETPEGLAAKAELQRGLAEELGGTYLASTESGGYIHMEDPDLVVGAVKQILETIEP